MNLRPSAWLPSAVLALALTHATGCWSVPADPGENARLRTRRDTPVASATADSAGGSGGGTAAADPAAESLYYTRCSQCHEAYPPQAFSAGEWPLYVDRYGPRAGLYGAERASVLRWLQANAR
jgi:hypothetical protein